MAEPVPTGTLFCGGPLNDYFIHIPEMFEVVFVHERQWHLDKDKGVVPVHTTPKCGFNAQYHRKPRKFVFVDVVEIK